MIGEQDEGFIPIRKKERHYSFDKTENLFHGIHHYTLQNGETIAALSAQTWPEYLEYLSQVTDEDGLVVSPELITFTGQPLDEVRENRELIEARIEEVKEESRKHPSTLFLLGTPTFPEKGKPRNSVVFVQNGGLISQAHKRTGATSKEYKTFDLLAEEPPSLIPETNIGLLICADIFSLLIFNSSQEGIEERLRLFGKSNLIGAKPTFIHPEAKNLLVMSCWGVGGNRRWVKQVGPNQYYLEALRECAEGAMKMYPQLEAIIQVDRTPLMAEKDLPFTPTHPFNAFYQRKK